MSESNRIRSIHILDGVNFEKKEKKTKWKRIAMETKKKQYIFFCYICYSSNEKILNW